MARRERLAITESQTGSILTAPISAPGQTLFLVRPRGGTSD